MRIESVTLKNFPPFADATIPFPERAANSQGGEVHLLTGQNGSGKTRLLCLLAAACGNRSELDSRILNDAAWTALVAGLFGSIGGIWSSRNGIASWWTGAITPTALQGMLSKNQATGAIGQTESLMVRAKDSSFPDVPTTSALAFRGMARISDAKIAALQPVKLGSPAAHLTFERFKDEDHVVGQSMANIKMSAAMDAMKKSNGRPSRAIRMMEGLEGAVSRITGRDFSFDVTDHPEVRLRVYWGGVEMRLLQLPDGLRSIIGWLVACVAKLGAQFPEHEDPLSLPLILLLDEPEGHLHPAWQRKILPAAQALFPQAQIFVATHSPFVISSVNEGWIHIFRANETGIVTVDQPRPCSKGDTYLDVVEDILGVKEWYDPESEDLLAKFRHIRDAALAGQVEKEPELVQQAQVIAQRSDSLSDLMAREMRQFERQKAQATTGS